MSLGGYAIGGGQPTPRNLELAYEAAKTTLARQNALLTKLRNRATLLFASAAIAASFTAGAGLIGGDGDLERRYPLWAAIALLVVLTLMAAAVLAIHWPVSGWTIGPGPSMIRSLHAEGRSEAEVRRSVVDTLIDAIGNNRRHLDLRQKVASAVILLLWAEVTLILLAMTTA